MNEQKEQQNDFVIIGENIHATRVVKRSGVRGHVFDNGVEAVKYKVNDEIRYLRFRIILPKPNHINRVI